MSKSHTSDEIIESLNRDHYDGRPVLVACALSVVIWYVFVRVLFAVLL